MLFPTLFLAVMVEAMEAMEGAMEEAVAMEVVVAVEAVADVEDSENIYPYKTIQDLNTASKKS